MEKSNSSNVGESDLKTLFEDLHLETIDALGGRSLEIRVSPDGGGTVYTTLFHVSEGSSTVSLTDTVNVDTEVNSNHTIINGQNDSSETFELSRILEEIEIHGGTGSTEDTLKFTNTTPETIDLSNIDRVVGNITGIEKINLSNGVSDTLLLNGEVIASLSDITDNTSGKSTFAIDGNSGDTVDLGGEFSQSTSSGGYTTYESDESIVTISDGVTVTGLQGG